MFFAWLVGVGSPANAQTPPPDPDAPEARVAQARELYKLGAGLYKAGRYKEAIAAFEEAYALSGNEKILYNIANAQERLGDLAGAINSLRAYRPYASPSDVVSLDLRIAAIESRMEQIPPLQPAPAPRPEAVVREAPVPTPLPTTSEALPQSRPRWALVGTGAALAVGFGATAVFTYLEGQDRQMASDA
ncbi:MAG: tetratricopeptide repeat protein, partial [Myxococcota bacterium]